MAGSVRPSHELLHEKLLDSGYEVLHKVTDKDALLNGPEIVRTGFRVHTVIMKVTLCRDECTPLDYNI